MLQIDDDEYWDDQDEEAGSEQECGDEDEPEYSYRLGSDFDEQDEEGIDTEGMEDPPLEAELASYGDELGFDEDELENLNFIDEEGEDDDIVADGGSPIEAVAVSDQSRLGRFAVGQKRGSCPRCEHPNAEVQDYLLGKGRSARCMLCGVLLRQTGVYAKLIKEGLN
jgi:hypothetical protein